MAARARPARRVPAARRARWASARAAGGWNFGPADNEAKPVDWIASAYLQELWGPGLKWEARPDPGAVHEAHYLKLDSSKAHVRLGWDPAWGWPTACVRSSSGSARSTRGGRVREVSLGQIEAFGPG